MTTKTSQQPDIRGSRLRGYRSGRPAVLGDASIVMLPQPRINEPTRLRIDRLVDEWLTELDVMGRSPATLRFYRQQLGSYLASVGAAQTLSELTGSELKRYLGVQKGRGMSENTVHHDWEALKVFARWAEREGYPVDATILRVQAPKVSQNEMECFSEAEMSAILRAVPAGWPSMAIQLLLGTGMRVSELIGLGVGDIEDDGASVTLKVQRGKGAKFRRAPVSSRLRRELIRYLNRYRGETSQAALLLNRDSCPLTSHGVTQMLSRLGRRVGFRITAHKFRHTFATEYLRRGGEIERLRRILGHSTYAMVIRYVHLDRGDLCQGFDQFSPF